MPSNLKLAQLVKNILVLILVSSAWLFSRFEGSVPDAFEQIYLLGALSLASILCGFYSIPKRITALAALCVFVMLLSTNPYWGLKLSGVSGILLALIACQVGVRLVAAREALVWLLFAMVLAAAAQAFAGLLQWAGIVGSLYRWIPEPELRGEAYGMLRQPNLFATFMCVGAIFTAWLLHLKR